jgi:hypothetical protein
MDQRLLKRAHVLLVLATITLTLSVTWIWGGRHNYIPCISDCGETFIAQLYARNFQLFGFGFGLVEDHATSPSAAAHPYYYTHNVNIGGLYYVLLEALGVGSFPAKQFFVLLIFGVGLFYAYAAVALHTKSRVAAYCVLVAACLDFAFFLAFGLHALRVWTWLALFGLLLHVGRFAQVNWPPRLVDSAAILILSAIAFGIGYEFWIMSICVAIATHCFFSEAPLASREHAKRLGLLLLFLFVPFALRQLHIAAVLGIEYWAKDFYYTFAAKIPFATYIFDRPTPEMIEQFYRSHNVMLPPTEAIHSVGEFTQSLLALIVALVHGTLPQAGLLTMVLTGLMAITAVVFAVIAKARRQTGPNFWDGIHFVGSAKLLAALSVGIGLGCLVMPRMVVHFYFALGMPLLGSVIAVAKGLFVALLVAIIRADLTREASRRLALAMLAFLVVDHGLVQAANVRAARPMDTSWIPTVSARPAATYAVSFIAPVVGGFTSNWAVGIKAGREWEMLEAASRGIPPFQKDDLFWFGERDAEELNWEYLKPDYWLYFPIDRRAPFLSAEPECRKDYLSALFSSLISDFAVSKNTITSYWDLPARARPASRITVKLKLKPMIQARGVSFSLDGKTFTPASFNCISNLAIGELQLPDEHEPTALEVIAVVSTDGRPEPISINLGKIELSSTAHRLAPAHIPRLQPSVKQILSDFPKLRVEHSRVTDNPWEGFVLIDLGHLHGKRSSAMNGDCPEDRTAGALCAR